MLRSIGGAMANFDMKAELHGYLSGARETLLWKLEGLSEYDSRRPLTPTGTNLLGLVKHSTASHLAYFGEVFGRSTAAAASPLSASAGPAAEFWATPEESTTDIVNAYRLAWDFADETVAVLPLDAVGQVPWWGDAPVTLHHVMVHVTADTQRHAGHADIVRELIDGSVGLLRDADNLHVRNAAARRQLQDRVQSAANHFR